MLVVQNGLFYGTDCCFRRADIGIQDGLVAQLAPPGSLHGDEVLDATECYVLPGFVDIHSHGCVGSDICDADAAGLERMLAFYGSQGVTSVVATTMSYTQPMLAGAIEVAKPYFGKAGYGAVLQGINMEGPFVNVEKRGAQNPDYIMGPQPEMFEQLYAMAEGWVRMVDLAPELPGAEAFIRAVSGRCVVSIAHTNATYAQACAAFDAGASHVTHLFNAMPPFGHREPGVIGAASDRAAHVELIADGVHLHPAVVRAVFMWFGPQRVCLISDSMRGTGMPDGEYDLGGQAVRIRDGRATLVADGAIAGSVVHLADMCRRAIGFGVPMEQVICAATLNPARAVGLEAQVGSLAPGMRADVVVWDKDLRTRAVLAGGQRL